MVNPTKTEAIKELLLKLTHADLAKLYNSNMECQVNVSQDGGERIEGEYNGKRWLGWTDGITTWKAFRIPWNASTSPKYIDNIIKFDLAKHAEGIGMTGWDWLNKESKWVAFDFDSIVSHKEGLTHQQLSDVETEASDIDWVTVRKSTSGNGIHFYVHLDPPIPTQNHNEHAALARAILGQLAAQTGFDFINKVDICGGNMWVWHKKMSNSDGLKILKRGNPLTTVPKNWRDHVKVITGSRRKNLPQEIDEQSSDNEEIDNMFSELTGTYVKQALDIDHKKLISFLKDNQCFWWWDQDNNMLVTHTYHLLEAFGELNIKGFFSTSATGKDKGRDHNCFMYPLRRGGWAVRRFTPGVRESHSWNQDGDGWTRCFFNIEPDLDTAARSSEGIEHQTGGYVFNKGEDAQSAALSLGADLQLPTWALGRKSKLKEHKDGRLIAEIARESTDNYQDLRGWLDEGKKWTKIFSASLSNPVSSENKNYDDVVRHLISEQDKDAGWTVKSDGNWIEEPLAHIRLALRSLNVSNKDTSSVLGDSIFRQWKLVNKPFQPEYTGNREWNRDSCQLLYNPSKEDILHYPTWSNLLKHVGDSLTPELHKSQWAVDNYITTGAEYLKCWIASLFQQPEEHLPYLYLWGPESSGKSMFHEAISLLISASGYQRATAALENPNGFNGELRNAIICVVEEVDLSKKGGVAYKRIKDWVTAEHLPIHVKNQTPYMSVNTTHWIQCSNDQDSCPIFTGDTRIMVFYVSELPEGSWENKRSLVIKLRKEAADFLGALMRLEIPESPDRLGVPIVSTTAKEEIQKRNQNSLEGFISEECYHSPGHTVLFSDFYNKFATSIESSEIAYWTKIKVGKNIPKPYVKAKATNGTMVIGNISFTEVEPGEELIAIDNRLVHRHVNN